MTDKQEPVAWKHDCAGLCTNDVELWIDACPHCGKPRAAPPAQPVEHEHNCSTHYHGHAECDCAAAARPADQGHSCTHKCTWPQCEAAQPAPVQEPQPVSNTDELPQRLSDERIGGEDD